MNKLAESELAMAPVWDEAALLPADELPALMAASLNPLFTSERA